VVQQDDTAFEQLTDDVKDADATPGGPVAPTEKVNLLVYSTAFSVLWLGSITESVACTGGPHCE